ncbi:MAG: glycosyltransferase [Patescibacteria group bacterium]
MKRIWRIRNGIARISLANKRFFRLLKEEINNKFFPLKIKNNIILIESISEKKEKNKPIFFASACVDQEKSGSWKYNGGIKELNYLVKLLREKGYEAYMVTYDGKYEKWLIEHQPHISIQEFKEIMKENKNTRCITSWAAAQAFIDECDEIFFWDMELLYSEHKHYSLIAKLYRNKKIKKTAAISRTIQAWHMANFEKKCLTLPNLIDLHTWQPAELKRQPKKIGYMDEGDHTDEYIQIIKNKTKGLNLKFQLIQGYEEDILTQMQSCEIFLNLNKGKDDFWGEGCPRTIIEAMATGCISISFDVIGNKEMIIDNFNGFIIPRYRPDLMATKINYLFDNPETIDTIRKNTKKILDSSHSFKARWPIVKEFLELPE